MWYVASVRDRLRTALQEVEAQSTVEACQQKQYYDRKIGTVNLKPGTNEGGCLEGKEEDQGYVGRRALEGGASNHTWHPLLQSDEPMWMVMSPPLKLTSSHCIRDWCSLVYGQPSYKGQVYLSHPTQDYLYRRWKKEDATREKW